MPLVARLFCTLLLACLSPSALGERLRLVSDDWAPYIYQQNGQPHGIDYEVTTEVFKRLGVQVEWQFLPWKRCLAMIEQGLADGIMDIFQTEARRPFPGLCPRALVASRIRVVPGARTPPPCDRPRRPRRPHHRHLARLCLRRRVQRGYRFPSGSRPTQEANFGKLLLGRIDLAITDRTVGHYLLRQLGLEQQVEALPLVINRQAQYLGLVRKPGREALAQAFAEALQRFKQEPAFAAINQRYTGDIGNILNAVEQQESSTAR
ncbi:substrate-binding periplasmic protein [Pseudomonas sp. PhalM4]